MYLEWESRSIPHRGSDFPNNESGYVPCDPVWTPASLESLRCIHSQRPLEKWGPVNQATKTRASGGGSGQLHQSGGSDDEIDEVRSAVTHSQAPFSTSALGFSKENLLESIPLSFHEIAALCTENEP